MSALLVSKKPGWMGGVCRYVMLGLLLFSVLCGIARAQQDVKPQPGPEATTAPVTGSPDGQIVTAAPAQPKSPAEVREAAWVLLSNGVKDEKHSDAQTQALAAIGLLGNSPRGLAMITETMKAKDLDIRSAAAQAAGQTKAPAMTTPLRELLDDKEPPVVFTAAVVLWKLKDYSGEDILMAVASGGRTTSLSTVNGAEHDLSHSLHHPAGVAKFAAMQGAGILLGPFGYGITAYEYLHKNGGDASRITAIELVAQNHTNPIRQELLEGLKDHDPGVRLASAKALSRYHDAPVGAMLGMMLDDEKAPVRFTAAAAYLISTGAAPGVPDPNEKGATAAPARHR